MAKHVVPGRQVAHLWAHASEVGAQDEAHNSNRSMFYADRVLYSYGSHFPIGLRLESTAKARRAGADAVIFLLTEDHYSITTSKHQSWARNAVHGTFYYVPRLTDSRHGPVDLLSAARVTRERARDNLDRALKMRKTYKRYGLARDADRWYSGLILAARATGQLQKVRAILGDITKDVATALEGCAEYTAKMEANRERRNAQERARQEMRRKASEADALIALERWRKREPMHEYGGALWALPFVALRLSANGEEVESTKGARFPVEHARKLWPVWAALVENGRGYIRNGHTIHLGAFALDRIDPDGTITAGCHTIKPDEVLRLARELGLTDVDYSAERRFTTGNGSN